MATNPDALWIMNESSGSTAFDSLSGHHDATAISTVPTWQAAVSPPGTSCPLFPADAAFQTVWQPALTGDFTFACWVNRPVLGQQLAMGCGDVSHNVAGFEMISGFNHSEWTNYIYGGAAYSGGALFAIPDNNMAVNTWWWVVLTMKSGTLTLYVNAAAQSAPVTGTFLGSSAYPVTIGEVPGAFGSNPEIYLAWATVWSTRALSASEIGGIYATL